MYKVTNFKWVPRKGWMDKVYDLLQPAIRFTKDQCMDLPPKTYVTREVPMSKVQEEAYNTLREQLAMALEGEMVTAVNAASGMSKLLQISSGSVYTDEGETLDFDISARFKELCEIIDASPNKVLVFVPFVNAIERLSSALEAKGYTAAVIRGGVSLNKRNQIISDFQQEENPRVLVLQPSSISHGVTLHAADTSVWWGPVMSYETYAQANDRMHRKGQENPCTVIHLQSSPVEKLRFAALSRMQDDSEGLLEMYKEVLSTV